ncbi:hypothetical protein FGO68_gene8701 [Halteria grandinella]|uniref:Uncharacterized protein n=1 Tax=Halteria grandinella TaxID=5974 RepID=A0A8J8SU55_HALGN|nr:hypothetical protein FGO68_gene8701 [Halteria grandinella]
MSIAPLVTYNDKQFDPLLGRTDSFQRSHDRQEEYECSSFASCRQCERGLYVRQLAPRETLRQVKLQQRCLPFRWRHLFQPSCTYISVQA